MMEINDGDLEKNWVKKIFYLFHHLIAAFSPFDVFSLIIVFILAGFSATFFDRYIDVLRANTGKTNGIELVMRWMMPMMAMDFQCFFLILNFTYSMIELKFLIQLV